METTAVNQDFLVELRGFEPPTSAVQGTRALDGAAASGSAGLTVEGAPLDPALIRPALLQKPGGGQSFGSSPLVVEAKFLPDPGEVVAAYRIVTPWLNRRLPSAGPKSGPGALGLCIQPGVTLTKLWRAPSPSVRRGTIMLGNERPFRSSGIHNHCSDTAFRSRPGTESMRT